MTNLEQREKSFEEQFLRDRETYFRIVVRRNKLLGHWAAKCLGLWGKAADNYVLSVVDSEIFGRGDAAVMAKLLADLGCCAFCVSEGEIREQMKLFDRKAIAEILGGLPTHSG